MEPKFAKIMHKLSVLANQIANGGEDIALYEDICEIAKTISDIVDSRDAYNQGHSQKKAFYATLIAYELELENKDIELIKIAALLHDIGKIGIDKELLQKKGKLTQVEIKILKKHPLISERILTSVGFPSQILAAIRSHHESPNGEGYPDGLCKNEIPIEASIIKVADAFGAMISDRPYRPALSFQDAMKQLKAAAGTEFDPEVVNAFQQILELEEKRKTKKHPSKKVLIGNSDLLNTNLLAYSLEKEGFDTLCAYNGEDILEKVYSSYPDFILLNVCLPDILATDICRRIKNDPRSTYIPIITFGAKKVSEEIKILESGADTYITDIFNPKKLCSQINVYLRRIDYEKSLNPLTGLPGNFFIKEEIKKRINQQEKFAVLYPDLKNLKAFNKAYGFFQGDEVIKLTAKVINETIKKVGNPTDFIGHRGGDEFVIITSLDKIDKISNHIISTFNEKIKSLYLPEDISRGYITLQEEDTQAIFPIMTVSIGVLTNEKEIRLDSKSDTLLDL